MVWTGRHTDLSGLHMTCRIGLLEDAQLAVLVGWGGGGQGGGEVSTHRKARMS